MNMTLRKNFTMDYRRVWRKHFPYKIKDYEIHHIDSNKRNNLISNLIYIPKKLHKQYHWSKNFIAYIIKEGDFSPLSVSLFANNTIDMVEMFINTSNEILNYIKLRDLYLNQNIKHSIYFGVVK